MKSHHPPAKAAYCQPPRIKSQRGNFLTDATSISLIEKLQGFEWVILQNGR
jgi:hypothetical protein